MARTKKTAATTTQTEPRTPTASVLKRDLAAAMKAAQSSLKRVKKLDENLGDE